MSRKKLGIPCLLTNTAVRELFTGAYRSLLTERQLQKAYDIPLGARRVMKLLQRAEHVGYKKIKRAIVLTLMLKNTRIS